MAIYSTEYIVAVVVMMTLVLLMFIITLIIFGKNVESSHESLFSHLRLWIKVHRNSPSKSR
jgi:hypothetical protein